MPNVFFYGGLINPDLRARLGVRPRPQISAKLRDYALTISPWVNVQPETDAIVFGVVMDLAHDELDAIYAKLAVPYDPHAVVVTMESGETRTALCYIASRMTPGIATPEHVLPLLEAAEAMRFPSWYLARIRSFLPASQDEESA